MCLSCFVSDGGSQSDERREEIRKRNAKKKEHPCLGCGEIIYTPINQRLCKQCAKKRDEEYEPRIYRIRTDGIKDPRKY